ncbi:MAG: hypothetical protein GXC78_20965 [Chitinophagaceae bacterium]|jgi:hypothetical protein|nr:hypothetical protein [Chitinophagaceae bacterium]
MKTRARIPVLLNTVVVVIYILLQWLEAPLPVLLFIVTVFPLLLVWMVIAVLRFDDYKGPELKADEEWGYADKKPEQLGTF